MLLPGLIAGEGGGGASGGEEGDLATAQRLLARGLRFSLGVSVALAGGILVRPCARTPLPPAPLPGRGRSDVPLSNSAAPAPL